MTTFVLCCRGLGVLRLFVVNEPEKKVTNGDGHHQGRKVFGGSEVRFQGAATATP